MLTIHLLYTCACSFLPPPEKTFWREDGFLNTIWTAAGVPPPSFGRFKMDPRRFPELSTEYDFVYAVGNSLMKNFSWRCYLAELQDEHCAEFMKDDLHPSATLESRTGMRNNLVYSNGIGQPLNTRTVHTKFLPRIERGLQEQKKSEKLLGAIPEDRSAFIIGSCIWDLASNYDLESFDKYGNNHKFGFYELDDHLEAIRIFISEIKRLHPLRQIYWKSCTALHRQVYHCTTSCPDAVRYASLIRGRHLDAAQKELLGDLDIPVIDMFEMTYEMPELHRPEDSMHYNAEMAIYWADYFLPEGDETASASS